jgi:hypothetical protein
VKAQGWQRRGRAGERDLTRPFLSDVSFWTINGKEGSDLNKYIYFEQWSLLNNAQQFFKWAFP